MSETVAQDRIQIGALEAAAFRIGYGTYHLMDKMNASEAIDSFGVAYEAGINLFDTSDNYGTELAIGRAVSAGVIEREHVVIATKTGLGTTAREQQAWDASKRRYNTDPERVRRQVDNSLRVLGDGVGIIDLYQLHVYDPEVPHEAHAELMSELVEEEKIRAWGVSNYSNQQLTDLLRACDERGLDHPATSQPFHNILSVKGTSAITLAQKAGMVVLAHSPLLKSALTERRFAEITDFITSRQEKSSDEEQGVIVAMQPTIERLQRLIEMAHGRERNLPQLAIAWTLQDSHTITLTTPTNPTYLAEALDALEWKLESDITEVIDELRTDVAGVELFSDNAHRLVRSFRGY